MSICVICAKDFTKRYDWSTACLQCYRENQSICGCGAKYFNRGKSWIDSCAKCYRAKPRFDCVDCGKSCIRKFEFSTRCYPCYVKSK